MVTARSGHINAQFWQPRHLPLSLTTAGWYPLELSSVEIEINSNGQKATQSSQPLHRSLSIKISTFISSSFPIFPLEFINITIFPPRSKHFCYCGKSTNPFYCPPIIASTETISPFNHRTATRQTSGTIHTGLSPTPRSPKTYAPSLIHSLISLLYFLVSYASDFLRTWGP